MKKLIMLISTALMAGTALAQVVSFNTEYTAGSGVLDPVLVDEAIQGGADLTTTDWVMAYESLWTAGSQVSLTAITVPIHNQTGNGTWTFNFYDIGADNTFSGTGVDTLVGSITASYVDNLTSGAKSYAAIFSAPLEFTASGSGVAIHITTDSPSLRYKVNANANLSVGSFYNLDGTVRDPVLSGGNPKVPGLTLAGTAVVPEPATVAMLLGAASLLFVVVRRRRQS